MIPTLTFITPEPPERDHGTGWQAHSACIGEDPDLFFPERGDSASVRAAKAVCARCPVVADCLDHAMGNNERGVLEKVGVWGGTTESERRKLRRDRRMGGAA